MQSKPRKPLNDFNFDTQRFGGKDVVFKKFTTTQGAQSYFKAASENWLIKLTAYEKSALTQYTGKAYEKINSYLRGELAEAQFKPDELTELKNKIEAIESALLKFEIQDNIILYRQCDEEFLKSLGKTRFGLYHEEGFWSTTAVEGSVYRGNVRIEIFFNAGIGAGAWLRPFSLHPSENEFLINRGAYFQIVDLKREGVYTYLKLSYVGRNARRIAKMNTNKIEAIEEFNKWLDEGEYQIDERFVCKPGELRAVETQEEFESVVAQCIKEGLWGLSPEGIQAFFESTSKRTHDLWRIYDKE